MIATADWSAPFYNEQPFFDKPVLFHQLQGTAMRLVGDPELGARLVPALAALGLVGDHRLVRRRDDLARRRASSPG